MNQRPQSSGKEIAAFTEEDDDRLMMISDTSMTVERFGEKISAEACSGKEIAGLLKKMMMMMMMMMMKNMMTRKSRNCI